MLCILSFWAFVWFLFSFNISVWILEFRWPLTLDQEKLIGSVHLSERLCQNSKEFSRGIPGITRSREYHGWTDNPRNIMPLARGIDILEHRRDCKLFFSIFHWHEGSLLENIAPVFTWSPCYYLPDIFSSEKAGKPWQLLKIKLLSTNIIYHLRRFHQYLISFYSCFTYTSPAPALSG